MKKPVYIIVAMDLQRGIGKNGKLPWHLKGDMKFFRETTMKTRNHKKQNMVIMGRKTWESIPKKFRPLQERENIVLTRNAKYHAKGATVVCSLKEALQQIGKNIESIFIIGGASVFQEALNVKVVDGIYLTQIHKKFDCDTFFPPIPKNYKRKKLKAEKEGEIELSYFYYYKMALSHSALRNS